MAHMTPKRTFSRRAFLRIVAAAGIGGATAYKLGWDRPDSAEAVSETRLLMGTLINLTLITRDARAGRAAVSASLDHMQALEAILSHYRADSQLSRLNRTGSLDGASEHLTRVLTDAQQIAARTGGAFDVTIKPLTDLYQAALAGGGPLPDAETVEAARACVGCAGLTLDGSRVVFERPGMAITLDGIAKGYIVDEGVQVLRAHGFTDVLVEAGGDLVGAGEKQARPWRIGIEAPRADGAPSLGAIEIVNKAVATSGDYMQPYTSDFSLHHILDPRTGLSAPTLASATVIADRCVLADALATAMMVLGPDEGLATLKRFPGSEGYLVGKDAQVWKSEGFVTA